MKLMKTSRKLRRYIAKRDAALTKIQTEYNNSKAWRSPWQNSAGAVSVGNSDLGITRQITNVAAGLEDTDAVNVAQNTRSISQLNNKIDEIDRRGRRGAAIAGAMGLLPQPRTNGKSTISTAAIHYRGEQALVVGYSHVTDNGKHIIKLSGASNMSGKKDVMLGAAYGYEW